MTALTVGWIYYYLRAGLEAALSTLQADYEDMPSGAGGRMSEKSELLAWLLKPRHGYPYVTYRGARMEAEAWLLIPLDEIAEYFGVDELNMGGKLYKRNEKRSTPDA